MDDSMPRLVDINFKLKFKFHSDGFVDSHLCCLKI